MQNFTVIRGIKYFALMIIAVISIGTIQAQSVDHSDCEECNEPFTVGKLKHAIAYGSSVRLRVSNPYGVKITSNLSDFLKGYKQEDGGNEVEVYFDTPGKYQITYSSLAMGKYLAHSETVSIEVSPISFNFLMDKASLSSSIVSGKSSDGIILTVPVEIKSYNGEKTKYGPFKNVSTGVDGIEVVFDEQVELTPGVHYLKYKLQGTPAGSGPCQIAFFNLLGEGYFYNFLISK